MNLKDRIGILSVSLPPSSSGQAIILYRLLKYIPEENLFLISSEKANSNRSTEKLNCKYFHLNYLFGKKAAMLGKIFPPLLFIIINVEIFYRAFNIVKLIKRENLAKIVVCTGEIHDLPAANIACKFTDTLLITYIFDDYIHQWRGVYRIIARIFEKQVLKSSSKIIVTNEFLATEIEKRYKIKSEIVRNAVEIESVDLNLNLNTGINFVFSGSLYYANYDVISGFLKKLNELELSSILNVFTSQPIHDENYKYYLKDNKVIIRNHLPNKLMKSQYYNFDILLLPLSFLKSNFQLIKTSAPAKLGEYLNSGKPLMAIVPKDCYVDWYFKTYKCGFVVNDLEELHKVIIRIVNDKEDTRKIVYNAIDRSRIDFDIRKEREKFYSILCS